MTNSSILDSIIASRKQRVALKKKTVHVDSFRRTGKPPQSLFKKNNSLTLIAECKKGSPSKGIFLHQYDPIRIAKQYECAGADAVSVITEPDYFFGDESDLIAVRQSVSLPLLRKDFIFDPYQITESWALGADALLLIASIASESQLHNLVTMATNLGMETLLEIHTEEELKKVLNIPATAIGINARNLKSFTIDREESKRLCRILPKDILVVAESGIKNPQDGLDMYHAGFKGFLVGEYFITAQGDKREQRVKEFSQTIKKVV